MSECGTHATVDAGFWPCTKGEAASAMRLLRSVEPGMLLTWDRGFHSFDMAMRTRAREALYQRLLRDVARARLPERENRMNPRVVKRKMSNFKRKRAGHRSPPKPTKTFRQAVVLLN